MPFKTVRNGGFEHGNVAWFPEGQLNASYNCVDRWAFKHPDKVSFPPPSLSLSQRPALDVPDPWRANTDLRFLATQVAFIYEADEPDNHEEITYAELLKRVCETANTLKKFGVKKGDTVIVYLPMIPEAAVALLACARIGAVHSVVFAGFSADSLRDRAVDCDARVVITTDEGRRGGRTIATKSIVDAALKECPKVEHCLVVKRTGNDVGWTEGRDKWWHEENAKERPYCPPVSVNSEDPLFILYTSGSTGKPKGVVHTTGGYLLGTALTVKHVFDVHEDDKFACMADVGWITGHSYIVYGPLMNGVTSLIFESTPVYPTASRYWEMVSKHKITQFYT